MYQPPAFSFLTHLFGWDSLSFGPQLSQLHLICLDHLTPSEAIRTSSVKVATPGCDWPQDYPAGLCLPKRWLNGPR